MADGRDPFTHGDSTDVRIRDRLDRAVVPADPAGAYERVVEKKVARRVRRRLGTVALAAAVVAGTVTGSYALIRTFGGPSTSQRPVGSPTNATVTVPPSPGASSQSSSPAANACLNSSASADFDANGSKDSVFVHPAECDAANPGGPALWSINFSWGPRHTHDTEALPQCTTAFCGAAGVIPMNDGTMALILRTDQDSSYNSYVLLSLAPGHGPKTYVVTGTGGEDFASGQPAIFVEAGTATHVAYFNCRGGPYPGGGDMATVVEIVALMSPDQTTWHLVRTELAHGPRPERAELVVVSQHVQDVAVAAFDAGKVGSGYACARP